MCAKQAIKLRGKIPKLLPQTIVSVNDFVWKPGISTIALEDEMMEQEEEVIEEQQAGDLEGEGNGARQRQENDDGVIVIPIVAGLNNCNVTVVVLVVSVVTTPGIPEEV